MIEIKYIGNVYKFNAIYTPEMEDYLLKHNFKALIIHKVEYGKCKPVDVYLFDTFNRTAYNCYYDLAGNKMRRLDSGAILEILESMGIDVDCIQIINLDASNKMITKK